MKTIGENMETNNAEEIDRMLTLAEISQIMNVSLQTVRRMVKDGVFPRVFRLKRHDGRLGHTRVYLSDFERFRQENTQNNNSPYQRLRHSHEKEV